jgi:hypothetical protein
MLKESGNSYSFSSACWLFESVCQPLSFLANFLFSAFTKDTLCMVKAAKFRTDWKTRKTENKNAVGGRNVQYLDGRGTYDDSVLV